LPISQFKKKAAELAQDVKAYLGGEKKERLEFKRVKGTINTKRQDRRAQRRERQGEKQKLHDKKQEYRQTKRELRATEQQAQKHELEHKKATLRAEISRLEGGLRATKERRTIAQEAAAPQASQVAGQDAGTGALPDFAVIGGKKCGTTFLYHLLSLHPHVQPAAKKELHFFDVVFDEGVEWYRRCFPKPKLKDGRMTITGEATPLMASRLAPERMAAVIPEARLIALLRNPVDRTYSDYQQVVRKGRETRPFEEAIGLERGSHYLSRSVYVDQLLRWSEYFDRDQMLALKSENLYENSVETVKTVLDFLGLPEWEPAASELPKRRNEGSYERGGMEPATRRKLEEFFRPHNERLYEYLGRDLGW
jgi:hypothetical protein